VHLFAEHVTISFCGGMAHAAHMPAQQIPAAHGVPSGTSPVATHAACPVLHDIVPVWHALPLGAHAPPAAHATHAPSRQTWPFPHGDPFGALPTGVHCDMPVAQDTTPVRHTLSPGLHAVPPAHATHAPAAQP